MPGTKEMDGHEGRGEIASHGGCAGDCGTRTPVSKPDRPALVRQSVRLVLNVCSSDWPEVVFNGGAEIQTAARRVRR